VQCHSTPIHIHHLEYKGFVSLNSLSIFRQCHYQ
jgi:hypothetical protein